MEHDKAAIIGEVKKALQAGRKLRSVLLPGECGADYRRALYTALQAGETQEEFDRKRLLKNGWTEEDEKKWLLHSRGRY